MNWLAIKKITAVEIGMFLALMLIVLSPHFSTRLPSALLGLLGAWLIWAQGSSFFSSERARRLAIIFTLLLIPILTSIPTSYDWRHSSLVALAVGLYFLVGLALVHALRGDEERQWLAKWITVIMIVWAVDGLIQYIFGRDLLGIPLYKDGRVTGFFARGNMSLSNMLAMLLPIALWYLLRKNVLAMLAFFILAVVIAIVVGSRNALVMMSVVLVGMWLRLPRRYSLGLIAVVLVMVGAIGLSPIMQERMQRFSGLGTMTFEKYDHLTSGRLTIWETAGKMIVDRPLTGVGAGMFAKVYEKYSTRPNDPFLSGGTFGRPLPAHNVYLSIAAESGVFGLLGIIVAFVLCVKWYFRASRSRRDLAWPYAFGLLIAMFPLSIEHTLYVHYFFPVALLLLAAMLAALQEPLAASRDIKKV